MRKRSTRPPVKAGQHTEHRRQMSLFPEPSPPAGPFEAAADGTPAFHGPVGSNPDEPRGVMAEDKRLACIKHARSFTSPYPTKPIRKGTVETYRYLGRCCECRELTFGEMPTFDPRPAHTLF